MADESNRAWKAQYMLRLPEDLRDRIKADSEKNGRSMNAEIVRVLEQAFPAPSDVMYIHLDQIRRAIDEYEREKDPRRRLWLQTIVEMLVTGGHDVEVTDDEISGRDEVEQHMRETFDQIELSLKAGDKPRPPIARTDDEDPPF